MKKLKRFFRNVWAIILFIIIMILPYCISALIVEKLEEKTSC